MSAHAWPFSCHLCCSNFQTLLKGSKKTDRKNHRSQFGGSSFTANSARARKGCDQANMSRKREREREMEMIITTTMMVIIYFIIILFHFVPLFPSLHLFTECQRRSEPSLKALFWLWLLFLAKLVAPLALLLLLLLLKSVRRVWSRS